MSVDIAVDADLLFLRERARHIATVLGFDVLGQVRLATAAWEVAREALRHGTGGRAVFALQEQPAPELVITFSEVAQAVIEGTQAIRPLVTRCETSASATGATLTLGVTLPDGYPADPRLTALALSVARSGPEDGVDLAHRENRELLESIQELAAKKAELEAANARLTDAAELMLGVAAKLERAERLQVVSRLTAGIAHHYNNLLTPIMGYAQLVMEDLEAGHVHHEYLQEVVQAAGSAAALTRQLLAYGQKQRSWPRVLDLNETVRRLMTTLTLMVDGHIAVSFDTYAPRVPVEIDQAQIEQVVMSIIKNARDAMPAGGELSISASTVELDSTAAARFDVPTGPFACLSILDFGCGMATDVMVHAFDPFFTTKSMAVAAGMGLAAAYGIIRQNGGAIQMESQLGIGTSVSIYLPLKSLPLSRPGVTASGTVLVVDDEPMIRQFVERALVSRGLTVLLAASSLEALAHFARSRGKIDLAVIEVKLPHGNGFDLAEQLLALAPGLAVMMMSASPGEYAPDTSTGPQALPSLLKPFSAADLLDMVRSTLVRPEPSSQIGAP